MRKASRRVALLEDRFPGQAGDPVRVVFAAEEGAVTDSRYAKPIASARRRLGAIDGVAEVTDPLAPGPGRMVSPDGRVALATVQLTRPTGEVSSEVLPAIRNAVGAARQVEGLRVELSGALLQYAEEQEVGGRSEVIGVAAAVVILLVAFGSVVAMGLPVVTALLGVGIGISLLFLVANFMTVNTVAPVLASMIGIAVGIDYALFVVTRHREHLARGVLVADAAARANGTAGQAVLFAGGTVVTAMVGLAVVRIPFITALGVTTAVVVAVAVLLALTLLPALLGLIGERIDRLRVPGVPAKVEASTESGSWSARWARLVTNHRELALVAGTGALVVLALPTLGIRLGFPDATTAPEGSTRRQASELIAESFGPGYNGPLVVVADLEGAAPDAAGDIRMRLQDVAGVVPVSPPVPNPAGDAALFQVVPAGGPQADATEQAVGQIRSSVAPAVADATGADLLVGGVTAGLIDTTDILASRTPLFIAVVLALSFVLLLVVFRSVVVPIKAVLLNLLSITSAAGVVVAVFQWGWGNELLGVEETVPIAPFVPMMMFAILFGLSMDYEVFILSRIRERWLDSGDPHRSVVEGLAGTARVVTAAATIMVAVFASFIARDMITIKLFGIGLAVAVFLDATLVRLILVPAAMRVMGSANWWLPGWLDGALPPVDIEGESALDGDAGRERATATAGGRARRR